MRKKHFLYLNDLKNSKKFADRILLFYPNSNSSGIIDDEPFVIFAIRTLFYIRKNSFDFIVGWIVFLVGARSSMKSFYMNVSSYYVNEREREKKKKHKWWGYMNLSADI